MGEERSALAGLPESGEPVFYPKVGHCIYRGVTEDRGAPDTELLELEDLEEGSRILIPLARVPQLNLRPAGTKFDEIQAVLADDFEEPLEDEDERHALVEKLITDGSPRALALSLKRLHLLRQTVGLSPEEEQTRKKVRSWLAAEVSISRDSTRAEAQAFMTRVLQETMARHLEKEKEEAKERRRAAREQKKAEEAKAEAFLAGPPAPPPEQAPAPPAQPPMDDGPADSSPDAAATEGNGSDHNEPEPVAEGVPDVSSETPDIRPRGTEEETPLG